MAFTTKIAELIAEDKTGLLAKHESWGRVLLSEIADILNGAPYDSAHFNTRSGVPLARIRDVIAGKTSTYYSGEYEDAFLLSQGDLLIGMDGDFHIGNWGSQIALLNQRVCKLTPNDEFYDKALLGYRMQRRLRRFESMRPMLPCSARSFVIGTTLTCSQPTKRWNESTSRSTSSVWFHKAC